MEAISPNYPPTIATPTSKDFWKRDLLRQTRVISERDPIRGRDLEWKVLFSSWTNFDLRKLEREGLDISRIPRAGLLGGMMEGAGLALEVLSGTIKFFVKGNEEEVRAKNDKEAFLQVKVIIPGTKKVVKGQHMGTRALSEGRRSFGSFGSKRYKLLATGFGVFVSSDLRYEGEFYNNLFHDLDGKSTLIIGDTRYKGGFKNGAMSGRCEVERYDRDTQAYYLYFKGSYENNQPFDGTVFSSDGEEIVRYEGGELVKTKAKQAFENALTFTPTAVQLPGASNPSLDAANSVLMRGDSKAAAPKEVPAELSTRSEEEGVFPLALVTEADRNSESTEDSASVRISFSDKTSYASCPLIEKKLANLALDLSLDESLELLTTCIQLGRESAKSISGKECIIMIGNTGAGKSTFVNYLSGCTMTLKSPKELGLTGVVDVATVVPKAEGGVLDEVMAIGHTKKSKTFMPEVVTDKREGITFCDCPGFLDNRGPEINIANAVNVKNAMASSSGAKVVVLINYHSLLAEKARGLVETLQICSSLFGSSENISKYKDSLLLAVAHVPTHLSITDLKEWLLEDTPPLMQVLVDRLFVYDPLDRPIEGAWNRSECLKQIKNLPPIKNPTEIFQTVLTDTDVKALVSLGDQMKKEIDDALSEKDFAKASSRLDSLESLSVIEHAAIDRVIDLAFYQVSQYFRTLIDEFKTHCQFEKFDQASSLIQTFSNGVSLFGKRLNDLIMLEHLETYFSESERMSQEHYAREQELEEKLKEAEGEIRRLLAILDEQKRDAEQKLADQKQRYDRLLSEQQERILETEFNYAEIESALTADYEAMIRRKDEELRLAKELGNQEVNVRLKREKEEIEASYRLKLEEKKEEKKKLLEAFLVHLQAMEEESLSRQQELQEKLDLIEAQRIAKEAELKSIKRPSIAFGKAEWEKYFGDVGEEPPLPDNINEILNEQCPYWPESKGRFFGTRNNKVKHTHLLVLIPKTVDGKPLTLNSLGELIKRPRGGGHATKYRYHDRNNMEQHGDSSIASSYWALVSKDVIPESRYKSYADQCKLVHSSYRVSRGLELATSILTHHVRTGERLYPYRPTTFVRCIEEVKFGNSTTQLVIGRFGSSGLFIGHEDDGDGLDNCLGLSVSQKFSSRCAPS